MFLEGNVFNHICLFMWSRCSKRSWGGTLVPSQRIMRWGPGPSLSPQVEGSGQGGTCQEGLDPPLAPMRHETGTEGVDLRLKGFLVWTVNLV